MSTPDAVFAVLQTHGLYLLMPLAVVEGPVVSVAAGVLSALGVLPLGPSFLVLVLADLVGDTLFYATGRFGAGLLPRSLSVRLRRQARVLRVPALGWRFLVIGKLTHAVGALVLLGAGMARMPLPTFLLVNLLATLPKSAALLTFGWVSAEALVRVESLVLKLSLVGLAVALAFAIHVFRRSRRAHKA